MPPRPPAGRVPRTVLPRPAPVVKRKKSQSGDLQGFMTETIGQVRVALEQSRLAEASGRVDFVVTRTTEGTNLRARVRVRLGG